MRVYNMSRCVHYESYFWREVTEMNPDDMKPAYHDIMEALGNKQVISLISQNKANTFPHSYDIPAERNARLVPGLFLNNWDCICCWYFICAAVKSWMSVVDSTCCVSKVGLYIQYTDKRHVIPELVRIYIPILRMMVVWPHHIHTT